MSVLILYAATSGTPARVRLPAFAVAPSWSTQSVPAAANRLPLTVAAVAWSTVSSAPSRSTQSLDG